MHKLDLSSPQADQPVVDQHQPINDNQFSAGLVKPLETQKPMSKSSYTGFIVAAIIAVLAGIGTGYGSFKLYAKSTNGSSSVQQVATAGSIKDGDIFGSTDKDSFKDSARGFLEAGGLENEGTHHLLREGGPTQTVYLTSSVTDLSKLEGMEVEVWGETFKGQKAGWLMDVGRVQVVRVNGEKPE